MEIKSKSGPIYRLDFKWNSVRIICLSAVGSWSFSVSNIKDIMKPLKLKVKIVGHESITYRCPFWKRKAVVKRLYKS